MPHLQRYSLLSLLALTSCAEPLPEGPTLVKDRARQRLSVRQHYPNADERSAVGPLAGRVLRGSPAFQRLVRCDSPLIVFKDEEGSGADRMMTPRLRTRLLALARMVPQEWEGVRLRVTEAWDERGEHGKGSIHYEGRAADLTTSDLDPSKLGRLGALAVQSGFEWVFYEDPTHIHVSVRR
jgi:hypothetical protein